MNNLPLHLREETPPTAQCDRCGRKLWGIFDIPNICGMRQPDGSRCGGKINPCNGGYFIGEQT